MCRLICLLAFCECLLAESVPSPVITIKPGNLFELTGSPSGPIINPTKCDQSGNIYFRLFRAETITGISVSDRTSRTIDPTNFSDEAVPDPKSQKIYDFSVQKGTVYVLTIGSDQVGHVLKFSSDDGKYAGSLTLEPGFFPLRMAAFDSGAFVVSGMKKTGADKDHPQFAAAAALYDRTGRLAKSFEPAIEYGPKKSKTVTADQMEVISDSIMQGSGSAVYLLRPAANPFFYVLAEDGTIEGPTQLLSPEEKYVPVNLLVSGTYMLIEYVHDPQTDGTKYKFVQYDLTTGEPMFAAEPAPNLFGAFACYDWRGGYTFLSSKNGHRVVLTGSAR
jgi:hypothetical protein